MTAKAKQGAEHPPKPPVIFRVGFTGHRPERLPGVAEWPAIQEKLKNILLEIALLAKDTVRAECDVHLRLLSQLAEGSDRLAAQAAWDAGFQVDAILPFPVEKYREDFKEEKSREQFDEMRRKCRSKLILDYTGDHRDDGYAMSGELLLQQCDVLLAVWDGGESKGPGGTTHMMDAALRQGLPVVVVLSKAPDRLWAVRRGLERIELDPSQDSGRLLQELVAEALKWNEDHFYWKETWPRFVVSLHNVTLRWLGEGKPQMLKLRKPEDAVTDVQLPCLKKHFRWLDTLASAYGEKSRSAVIALQILGLLSVTCALAANALEALKAPEAAPRLKRFLEHYENPVMRWVTVLELMVIVGAAGYAAWVRKKEWHDRWLLYRSLAEQVRCMDILLPLGMELPKPSRALLGEGKRRHASFERSLRVAIARDQGVPDEELSSEWLARHVHYMAKFAASQRGHHDTGWRRHANAQKKLMWIAKWSLLGALAVWAVHTYQAFGGPHAEEIPGWAKVAISFFAGFLTAVAAASGGLVAQGEWKRLAQQSEAMQHTLESIEKDMEKRTEDGAVEVVPLQRTMEWAKRIGAVITDEVKDWQVLVAGKPPEGGAG